MSLCGSVALGLLQIGCAVSPTTTDTDLRPSMTSLEHKPQLFFPNAKTQEVKAIAMGAARSRGWAIVESTDDRLVVQRPLDPGSPLAQRMATTVGDVEVTSYFVDERGGVKVALDAAILSPTPSGTSPTRIDATEAARPALMESLESLHASWSQNRGRVARAAPPIGGARTAEDDGDEDFGSEGLDEPILAERQPSSWTNESAAALIAPTSTPAPAVTPVAPPATVADRAPVEPRPTTPPMAAMPPAPQPRRTPGGPAPVVDATNIMMRGTASQAPVQPMAFPAPVPQMPSATPPAPRQDPLPSFDPIPVASTSAYYAEQFARLRACNITSQGAILIDSRSDGEVYRIPCLNADSMLVQCQDSDCRGLL
ncbi:hypothetical protein CKO25_09920 [Thiocapsa imhoffii]|uniref:Uncharacterized protein n=2 Tax=Thiocapsa imhoffii TaxID=382777 RepID=A0A9X0WIX2_9GAMM|nr:hypothetical protein [Thiocapsa imhoffii]